MVLAARIWVLARAAEPETGYVDGATYSYAGRSLTPGAAEWRYRRTLLTRTIAIRNAHAN